MSLSYESTRGEDGGHGFADVLLRGLAADGGLYVPASWPHIGAEQRKAFAGKPFDQCAAEIVGAFTGDWISPEALCPLTKQAYAGFRHGAAAPLKQIDHDLFLLELFHGPTLAFKDVAMQLLGLLFERALAEQQREILIVGATSGDTGSAAIEAVRGRRNMAIAIFYPHGRVSEVQRRQMTTVADANVQVYAVDGDFDDCQRLVKALFADRAFTDEVGLSGVNSINWARIAAQVSYYFTAAANLGVAGDAADEENAGAVFSVPTGNFGDVFAGYVAHLMGLPVRSLMVAVNENDILARTLAQGVYKRAPLHATSAPSMDIQVASNFERLLFEATGRDSARVRASMDSLAQSGAFEIAPEPLARMRGLFESVAVPTDEVTATIRSVWRRSGEIIDPHTAIGVAAARRSRHAGEARPFVALATAHPAKFPDAVERAIDQRPELPEHMQDLFDRPEDSEPLPADEAAVKAALRRFRSRTTSGVAEL